MQLTTVITKTVQERTDRVATRLANDPSDRHDFVLHANGDSDKKPHLALLPFTLGSTETKED